jgi:hypothetical protein
MKPVQHGFIVSRDCPVGVMADIGEPRLEGFQIRTHSELVDYIEIGNEGESAKIGKGRLNLLLDQSVINAIGDPFEITTQ